MAEFNYTPVSKTILDFHNSQDFIKMIAGPPGSGKSSAVINELLFRAMRQPPNNKGVRQTRMGLLRQTYPKLQTTTMPTAKQWVPEEFGVIRETVPIRGTYKFPHPSGDGTVVESEWWFIAIRDDLDSLLSLELSCAFLNEVPEMREEVISRLITRVGRFPAVKDGVGCLEPGLILDFNLVAKNHWVYRMAEVDPEVIERPSGRYLENGEPELVRVTKKFFKQPPAVFCLNMEDVDNKGDAPTYQINAEADNLSNLPPNYYINLLKDNPTRAQWTEIKRMLLMEWVSPIQGRLVYENEYSREDHVSKVPLRAERDVPIIIGFDTSGHHPCAVFCQHIDGSLRVLNSLFGDNMSFNTFVSDRLKPALSALFPGLEMIAVCDPANARGSDTGITPVQQLLANGIKAITASTNLYEPRREAISLLLKKRNGLLISPVCEELINGFEATYAYPELNVRGESVVYANRPDKNAAASHFMDALQYASLYVTRHGTQKKPPSKELRNRLRQRAIV